MNKTFVNKHIDLNITVNTLQIAPEILSPSFPFTHYSTITDVSIFLNLSLSISPLFAICKKMNWTITVMHA